MSISNTKGLNPHARSGVIKVKGFFYDESQELLSVAIRMTVGLRTAAQPPPPPPPPPSDTKCDYRVESYDNASNTTAQSNGMQNHIRRKNPLEMYVPCTAHSLNLVRQTAIGCYQYRHAVAFVAFFDFVHRLPTAFSSRRALLMKKLDNNKPPGSQKTYRIIGRNYL